MRIGFFPRAALTAVFALCGIVTSSACAIAADDPPAADAKKAAPAAAPAPAAPKLGLGSPAPELKVAKWIQGDPVKGIEKGKIHVIEFWATWCGPCVDAIPHLNELAKKHKNVVVIGVDVLEDNYDKSVQFVKKMGDKMTYRVATDLIPTGGSPDAGHMASAWLEAAHIQGIPATFVINGEGQIAWIGHPLELDKPLEQIVAGTWDVNAAAAEAMAVQKRQQEQQAALMEVQSRLEKAMEAKDAKAAIAAIDDAAKLNPAAKSQLNFAKVSILAQLGEGKQALELLGQLEKQDPALVGMAQQLRFAVHAQMKDGKLANEAAKTLLAKTKGSPEEPSILFMIVQTYANPAAQIKDRDLNLALDAAQRFVQLTNNDLVPMHFLAAIHFERGEVDKALEVQKKVVAGAKGANETPEFEANLKKYEAAVKAKKG